MVLVTFEISNMFVTHYIISTKLKILVKVHFL